MNTLLLRTPGPATKARIANFGIELEVLSTDDQGGRDWCCEDCDGDIDDWEDDQGGSYNQELYMAAFNRFDLFNRDGVHEYHCACRRCAYDRSSPDFTAQTDPTVGMEWVSRILSSTRDVDVVERVVKAHRRGMNDTGWVPDGYDNNGNHIHVCRLGTDDGKSGRFAMGTMMQAKGLISSLLSTGDWEPVADGGCGRLRGYNGTQCKDESTLVLRDSSDGDWLGMSAATMEFRLWNTPSAASRIKAHVGLSIGILRWAFCQVIHDRAALGEKDHAWFLDHATKHQDDLTEVVLRAVPDAFRTDATEALEGWA